MKFIDDTIPYAIEDKNFTTLIVLPPLYTSGALLTDLSEAFDGILHELLTVKLYTYGVDIKSLRLLYSYSNGRRQRVKINDNYSSFEGMLS